MSIYLKKTPENEVLAMGDLDTVETLGGGTYDIMISDEDWQAVDFTARVNDEGTIVLGLTDDEVYERDAKRVRFERKRLLGKCDRISPMRWNSMTDEQKQAWTDFRQALLDIPQQEGFPWTGNFENIPWPKKPE